MQNPNEDTEWNDVLRAKGIIPQKPIEKEMTEDEIVQMLEGTIQEKTGGSVNLEKLSLGELDELEDDEEERVLAEYKAKRLRELKSELVRSKFGTVLEISAQDYTGLDDYPIYLFEK
ncbi:Viral IAP-associated factor [Folsomia candida]|uniref:Viral IAP-associated factor n=1 Tax=Folsomia candida TaxID=158441 RepID=A0A226EVM5_FOLCA|nr:Viral IAP-associated factor [Folsomia candida]